MSLKEITTLIFDCDGLLVDSEPWQFEARIRAAKKFGHHLSEEDFLYFWFDGNGGADAFCAKYNLPVEDFQREKHAIYDRFIDKELRLCPGVQLFLDTVKDRYQLALCSNSGLPDLERILAKFSLQDCFDTVISGNDLTHGKPDPEGFLLAAKRTYTAPGQALVLENSHIGLYAAKAAAMKCFVVPDVYGAKYQFTGADAVLNQIDEALGLL